MIVACARSVGPICHTSLHVSGGLHGVETIYDHPNTLTKPCRVAWVGR